jgi:hypothetical protein
LDFISRNAIELYLTYAEVRLAEKNSKYAKCVKPYRIWFKDLRKTNLYG